jgi:hypothetical protein
MKDYLSFSAWKGLSECQAKQIAIDNGEWEFKETRAMLGGRYLEARLCKTELPEGVLKKNGELYAEFFNLEETIQRVGRDPLIQEYLEGTYQEKRRRGNWLGIPDIVNFDKKRILRVFLMSTIRFLSKFTISGIPSQFPRRRFS